MVIVAAVAGGVRAMALSAPALAEQSRQHRQAEAAAERAIVSQSPTATSDGMPVPALVGGIVLAFAVGLTFGQVHRRRRVTVRRRTAAARPLATVAAPARPAPPPPEPAAPAPKPVDVAPAAPATPAPPPPEPRPAPPRVVEPPAPPVQPPPSPPAAEEPEPAQAVEEPEPTQPVEEPEPAKPVAEAPEPETPPVEEPEPAKPVAQAPEPETAPVEEPEPETPPVEEPEPEPETAPVEEPEPETAPVEKPEPAQPVGEAPEAPRPEDVPAARADAPAARNAPRPRRAPARPPAPRRAAPQRPSVPPPAAPVRRFARATPWPAAARELWTCEIGWKAGYRKSSFRAMAAPPGSDKREPLADAPAVSWTLMGDPEPPTPELAVRVRALMTALEAAGWEHIGRGGRWYAQRFLWRGTGDPQPVAVPEPARAGEPPEA
jgi:hypothetical protein